MLRNKTPSVFKKPRPFALWHLGLQPLFDFLGPKLNFFSLTVCKSEQYLKKWQRKD